MITSGLVVQNRSAYSKRFPSSYQRSYEEEIRPHVFESGKKLPLPSDPHAVEHGLPKYKLQNSVNYKQIFGRKTSRDLREYYLLNGVTQIRQDYNNLGVAKKLKRLGKNRFMIDDRTNLEDFMGEGFIKPEELENIRQESARKIAFWARLKKEKFRTPEQQDIWSDVVDYQKVTEKNEDGTPTEEAISQVEEMLDDARMDTESKTSLINAFIEMQLTPPEATLVKAIDYDGRGPQDMAVDKVGIFGNVPIHTELDLENVVMAPASEASAPVEDVEMGGTEQFLAQYSVDKAGMNKTADINNAVDEMSVGSPTGNPPPPPPPPPSGVMRIDRESFVPPTIEKKKDKKEPESSKGIKAQDLLKGLAALKKVQKGGESEKSRGFGPTDAGVTKDKLKKVSPTKRASLRTGKNDDAASQISAALSKRRMAIEDDSEYDDHMDWE